jgi:hypothetical protein
MRQLLTNTIVPALRHLLWIPVAALLVYDHTNCRQLQYVHPYLYSVAVIDFGCDGWAGERPLKLGKTP